MSKQSRQPITMRNPKLLDELQQQSQSTVAIEQICVSDQQPRKYIDPSRLEKLAASIKEHGILEPLLVRPINDGYFELVAGERRYRAAQLIGLMEVPIISKELSDQEAFQVAIIENLQREDLNPLEETEAILDWLSLSLSCDRRSVISLLNQVANARKRNQSLTENVFRQMERVDKCFEEISRFSVESFRTSRLPLLNLPSDILGALRQGKLEYTKARAIARIKDDAQRSQLLTETIEKSLSLASIKERVKDLATISKSTIISPQLADRLTSLSRKLKKRMKWNDDHNATRFERLLRELEELVEEESCKVHQ